MKQKVMNISVRLEGEMGDRLTYFSEKTGRPKSWFVRKALGEYFDEHADMLIAISRLEDRSDPVVSADEMWEDLGVGG